MVSPATAVAATRSASDSNFRCRREEWFRLQLPWMQRFSAYDSNFRSGKENGSACYGRGCNDLPRPILIFVAAKKVVPPAERHFPTAAVILDFRG